MRGGTYVPKDTAAAAEAYVKDLVRTKEGFALMIERAISVGFVEFKVAKISASNLYDWGFETPAAIVIVNELSKRAAHLLEKRVVPQWFEAVKKANLWSRWLKPADERARFRADLYLSDTNIFRLKIALRATIAEFSPRLWELDAIAGVEAVNIGMDDFKAFLKRLEALEIPKARRGVPRRSRSS